MTATQRFRVLTIAVFTLALALCARPGIGADLPTADSPTADEAHWQLRFGGVGVATDLGYSSLEGSHYSGGAASGVGISAEYRFSHRLGAEFGIAAALGIDGYTYPYDFNTFSFVPLTAGLNVHLTPDRKVDVYLGPVLAYVHYEDLTFTVYPGHHYRGWPYWLPGVYENLRVEDDFAFGANLGFDVRFRESRWSFCTALKYLATNLDATDRDGRHVDIDLDPVILSVGAGYRF